MNRDTMQAREMILTAALLLAGAILNYAVPVIAGSIAIPAGIEFVIVAYCLVVMFVPLRVHEVIGLGILAGLLNILSSPAHVGTILGGNLASPAGLMALFNFASEPAGILVCFFLFAFLARRLRFTAPLVVAFAATLSSGFVYLLLVLVFNPALAASRPDFTGMFLDRVAVAAVENAIVVEILFLLLSRPAKKYLDAGTA